MLALLLLAAAIPSELTADRAIRSVESGKLEAKQALEALELAWDLARVVKAPYPLRSWSPPRSQDSLAAQQAAASRFGWDALSLRVRVVRAMRRYKAERAWAMFEEMSPPAPPALACTDALAPRLEAYYELAGEMGFEQAWRVAQSVSHPSQLGPALRMAAGWRGKAEERSMLGLAVTRAMGEMRPDSRSFLAAPEVAAASLELAQRVEAAVVVAAYRAYLVAGFSGDVCFESEPEAWLKFFEMKLLPLAGGSVAAISEEEVEPRRILTSAELGEFWKDGAGKELWAGFFELGRVKSNWSEKLPGWWKKLESWKAEAGEERAWFHQQAMLRARVTTVALGQAERAALAERAVEFLRDSTMAEESPAEWRVAVEYLLQVGPDVRQEVRRLGGYLLNLLMDEIQAARA
jgi:hypothetical protein